MTNDLLYMYVKKAYSPIVHKLTDITFASYFQGSISSVGPNILLTIAETLHLINRLITDSDIASTVYKSIFTY